MTSRRAEDQGADKNIIKRKGNYQKLLCNGPGKVCEALGLTGKFNKASLFEAPFEIEGIGGGVSMPLNGPRINVPKGTEAVWRWGHPDFKEYLSQPFRH
jgi:DNA-3-methyladenine glycosylase